MKCLRQNVKVSDQLDLNWLRNYLLAGGGINFVMDQAINLCTSWSNKKTVGVVVVVVHVP